MFCIIVFVLSACGGDKNEENKTDQHNAKASATSDNGEMRTITHLDKEYEIPKSAERIVIAGAMESFEDSLMLDVHPVGAVTVGGEYPEIFTNVVKDAQDR